MTGTRVSWAQVAWGTDPAGRVGIYAVEEQVEGLGHQTVRKAVAGWADGGVHVGDADLPLHPGVPQGPDGQPMTEQLVMGGRQGVEQQLAPWRVDAQGIALEGDGNGFVHGDPVLHAVPKALRGGAQ